MAGRFHCPDCGSSLFHIEDLGSGEYMIECYKTKSCKWKQKIKEVE